MRGAREVDAPADALDREAVERQQVLGDEERRIEQRLGHASHLGLRADAVLDPPPAAAAGEARLSSTLAGVMLSAGVPSSELPSSGFTPSVIVPRVNAAAPCQRQHSARRQRSARRPTARRR